MNKKNKTSIITNMNHITLAVKDMVFDNKAALKMIKQGLQEAEKGELHDLGSFANYLDEDDTENI